MYSYHVFYFPFKWDIRSGHSSFSERISLDMIGFNQYTGWERVSDNLEETDYLLYNEKNYFYPFVHPVLYDTGGEEAVVCHFERREVKRGNVKYVIQPFGGGEIFELSVEDMVINLYSTGVGILKFYLRNDNYNEPEKVLRINQFGRRIFPPFLGAGGSVKVPKEKGEIADSIFITGLDGAAERYRDDFSNYNCSENTWKPARFIQSLVLDLSDDFVVIPYGKKPEGKSFPGKKPDPGIVPAVDDRMFVSSVILDEDLSAKIQKEAGWISEDDFWIRYVLVDTGFSCVQNDIMRDEVLKKCSYMRWQKYGTLFGHSRYSFVAVTGKWFGTDVLQPHFRTMYSRMVELALVQRASVLKFSGEVTRLSNLKKDDPGLTEKIRELYREYIRFVNQMYFREVTAQDQGIELYQALQAQIGLQDQVRSLDEEIEELHQYAVLLEDHRQERKLALLTQLGGMFLIPSLLVGYFGMNIFKFKAEHGGMLAVCFLVGIFLIMGVLYGLLFGSRLRKWQVAGWIAVALFVVGVFALTFFVDCTD